MPFYEINQPVAYDELTLNTLIPEADVDLGAIISSGTLEDSRHLKFLQMPGAGLDQLDLKGLAGKGICVCNSSSHTSQVAEHAVTMLLTIMRKVRIAR